MTILYGSVSALLELAAWISGVDAVRYIDPNWDKRNTKLLYPSIFYYFVKDEDVKENAIELP